MFTILAIMFMILAIMFMILAIMFTILAIMFMIFAESKLWSGTGTHISCEWGKPLKGIQTLAHECFWNNLQIQNI
jgi:hypothetical protein